MRIRARDTKKKTGEEKKRRYRQINQLYKYICSRCEKYIYFEMTKKQNENSINIYLHLYNSFLRWKKWFIGSHKIQFSIAYHKRIYVYNRKPLLCTDGEMIRVQKKKHQKWKGKKWKFEKSMTFFSYQYYSNSFYRADIMDINKSTSNNERALERVWLFSVVGQSTAFSKGEMSSHCVELRTWEHFQRRYTYVVYYVLPSADRIITRLKY